MHMHIKFWLNVWHKKHMKNTQHSQSRNAIFDEDSICVSAGERQLTTLLVYMIFHVGSVSKTCGLHTRFVTSSQGQSLIAVPPLSDVFIGKELSWHMISSDDRDKDFDTDH